MFTAHIDSPLNTWMISAWRTIVAVGLSVSLILAGSHSIDTASAFADDFEDDFEDSLGWTIFEEIVGGDICYNSGIGDVKHSTDFSRSGVQSMQVIANYLGSSNSNHVLAQKRLSDSGLLGTWQYDINALIDPANSANGQVGPEISIQSTREIEPGVFRTFIAGLQYVSNEHSGFGQWQIWTDPTGGANPTWVTVAQTTLEPGEWHRISLVANFDDNYYELIEVGDQLSLQRPGDISSESKFVEEATWITAEAENLWTECTAATSYSVYYDDVTFGVLETVSPDPFHRLFSEHIPSNRASFVRPSGLTIAPDGTLVVVTETGQRIEADSQTGSLLSIAESYSTTSAIDTLWDVAVNGAGVRLMTDAGLDRVIRDDPDIPGMAFIGTTGTGPLEFVGPTGIAVDAADQVYVVDTGNTRVQVLSPTMSEHLMSFGQNVLSNPLDIAITSDGDIFVTDFNFEGLHIHRFTADGTHLRSFGGWGTGPVEFRFPQGIATTADDRLLISDLWNQQIQLLDKDGTHIATYDGNHTINGDLAGPTDIAVDANGDIYISDRGFPHIRVLDSDLAFSRLVGQVENDPIFITPSEIVTTDDGIAFVADPGAGVIHAVDPATKDHTAFPVSGLSSPLAVGPGESLYYISDGQIRKRWPEGTSDNPVYTLSSFGVSAEDVGGLFVGTDGTVFLSDRSFGRVVVRNGQDSWVIGYGTLIDPRGITLDSQGRVHVADPAQQRISVYTEAGLYIGSYDSIGDSGESLHQPVNISSNSEEIYVSDSEGASIHVFDHNGNYLFGLDGHYGSGYGELVGVDGLAVASNGDVIVVDSANARLSIFERRRVAELAENLTGGLGDISVAPNGNIALSQEGGNVQILTPDGSSEIAVINTTNARAVVHDNESNFYIADGTRVLIINKYGIVTGLIENTGLWNITDIDVNKAGSLYVLKNNICRVQVYNSDHILTSTFEVCDLGGSSYTLASDVRSIAVDLEGLIYISSREGILVFDPVGNLVKRIGSFGSGPGQFHSPWDIEIDRHGYLYVSDIENDRVQVLDHEGNVVDVIISGRSSSNILGAPNGIAIDAEGLIYVRTRDAQRVQVLAGLEIRPEAVLDATYAIPESERLHLDATNSYDLDGEVTQYRWDLDGDGIYGEVGLAATAGDEWGPTPTLMGIAFDGPGDVSIGLEVTDDTGLKSVRALVPLSVANSAPTVAGVDVSAGQPGIESTLNVHITDSVWDEHTLTIDWGDGSNPETVGTSTLEAVVQHVYDSPGLYEVGITVEDDDGALSEGTTAALIDVKFRVNTTNDSDDGICGNLHCSLREAINATNARPGPDFILFGIPEPAFPGDQWYSIAPSFPLPPITDAVFIDGFSQPALPSEGTEPPLPIRVHLDGSSAGDGADGLRLTGQTTTVQGLSITGFDGAGIRLVSSETNTTGNFVRGNYLGIFPDGFTPDGNLWGVRIMGGTEHVVGGTVGGSRNVISGNILDGIDVRSDGNRIVGNRIGVDASGFFAVPNGGNGISIALSDSNTVVGNQIFYNGLSGVQIWGGSSSNVVRQNWVSFNGDDGIQVSDSPDNRVGPGNTIIRNGRFGVYLLNLGSTGTQVFGNWIGTDGIGSAAAGNVEHGIQLDLVDGVIIGGPGPADGNVISGNGLDGISTNTASNVDIQGNLIGLNPLGDTAVPNGRHGIQLWQSPNNRIGVGAGNVISGNALDGIRLREDGVFNTTIGNNIVGLNTTGDGAVPNGWNGMNIEGSETSITNNVVSGNLLVGIQVASDNNIITGNRIGTDVDGELGIGNHGDGIRANQANGNTIGGSNEGEGNLISDNRNNGITIIDLTGTETGSHDNIVQGNIIGTDVGMTKTLGNVAHGVWIAYGSTNTLVGGYEPGEENVIVDNRFSGIQVCCRAGEAQLINNLIGYTPEGTILPNADLHINFSEGAFDVLIVANVPEGAPDYAIAGAARTDCESDQTPDSYIYGTLSDGESIVVGCGSFLATVIDGPFDVELNPGSLLVAPSGSKVRIVEDPQDQFSVENRSVSTTTLTVHYGSEIEVVIGPEQTTGLTVDALGRTQVGNTGTTVLTVNLGDCFSLSLEPGAEVAIVENSSGSYSVKSLDVSAGSVSIQLFGVPAFNLNPGDAITLTKPSGDVETIASDIEFDDNINLAADEVLVIGSGAIINGNIKGDPSSTIYIGDGVVIEGNVDKVGTVILGNNVVVTGNLKKAQTVVLNPGDSASVDGNVDVDTLHLMSSSEFSVDGNVEVNLLLQADANSLLEIAGNLKCESRANALFKPTASIAVNGNDKCT